MIFASNRTIAIGVLRDLNLIFNVKRFLDMHLFKKYIQAADIPGRFASTRTVPRREVALVVRTNQVYFSFTKWRTSKLNSLLQ